MSVRAALYLSFIVMVGSPALLQAEPVEGRAEVLTGETLKISGIVYRLVGIDAPEKGQICQNRQGRSFDCGRISATGLMDLTAGAIVRCDPVNRQSDPILARCSAGGYDLSKGMVYTGWALPDPKTGAGLERQMEKAKAGKHGLWAGQFDRPWDWRHKHQ